MTTPLAPDPTEALLAEVVGIRRQLEQIGQLLATDGDGARPGHTEAIPPRASFDALRYTRAVLGPFGPGCEDPPPPPAARTVPSMPGGSPRVTPPRAGDGSPRRHPMPLDLAPPPSAQVDVAPPPSPPGDAAPSRVRLPVDAAPPPPTPPAHAPSQHRAVPGDVPSHSATDLVFAQRQAPGDQSSAPGSTAVSRPRRQLFTPERLLAIGGALVTILGVGFLLAVAIAAGIFGPVPRVASLALLAIVLAGSAVHLRERAADAAVAVAATSTAAAFGVVVAMTSIYAWLPHVAGIALALLLAGVGVSVAHRWRRAVLAGLTYLQTLIVLPFVLSGAGEFVGGQLTFFATLAFLPVVLVVLEHRWTALFRVAAGALLVVTLIGIGWWDGDATEVTVRLLACLLAVAVVAGVSVAVAEPVVLGVALSIGAATMLAMGLEGATLGEVPLDTASAVFGAVACALTAWRCRAQGRGVLGAGALLYLFLATVSLPVSGGIIAIALGFEALVLLLTARGARSARQWWASVTLTAVTALLLVIHVPIGAVLDPLRTVGTTRPEYAVVGALVAAIGVLHVRTARAIPVGGLSREARVLLGVALILGGASAAVMALGLQSGASTIQVMGAAVVTTVIWVAVAIGLILRPASIVSRTGYMVLAAAVAKLFLVDLHSVDGILRAVLFVLTGLALIGASSQLRRFTAARGSDVTAEP